MRSRKPVFLNVKKTEALFGTKRDELLSSHMPLADVGDRIARALSHGELFLQRAATPRDEERLIEPINQSVISTLFQVPSP